jgi:hypothetical protein
MIHIEPDAPPLLVIRKKRHRPKVGDVFAFQLADGLYRFGRVFHTAVPVYGKGEDGSILVVAYRHEADKMEDYPSRLLPRDILGPPLILLPILWSRGFFAHLQNRPFEPEEVPQPGPCFRYWGETYRDPDGNPMACNPKLLGEWAGTSPFAFAEEIMAAINEVPCRYGD